MVLRENTVNKIEENEPEKLNLLLATATTRSKSVILNNRDFKPRGPVVRWRRKVSGCSLKFFVERRPIYENMQWSGSFYHSIRRNRTFNDKHLVQTKPKGENTISINIMRTTHSWY